MNVADVVDAQTQDIPSLYCDFRLQGYLIGF